MMRTLPLVLKSVTDTGLECVSIYLFICTLFHDDVSSAEWLDGG